MKSSQPAVTELSKAWGNHTKTRHLDSMFNLNFYSIIELEDYLTSLCEHR